MFIWKQRLTIKHLARMFVLIWATVIFSATGISQEIRQPCDKGSFCVTMSGTEIRAEAGLCAILPCSFTTAISFSPQRTVWFKCPLTKHKCSTLDMIFHPKDNDKVQSEFQGRVALLDPELSQNNCSIIINDLTKSDSGSYQLRVNGIQHGKQDGYTFPTKTTVSVQDLSQKPTLMIPALTEGQPTTLTCTAPGFCSGSVPTITWTWRRKQEDPDIVENTTALSTENLTAVTQRHTSTLTFKPSAEHHGTEVTCGVTFRGNVTTEETAILKVTYMKGLKITGAKNVMEAEDLNLICSVESYPPSVVTWIRPDYNKSLHNETNTIQQNDTGADLVNSTRKAILVINNMSVEDSGQYICRAKHLNETLTENVNVTVMFVKELGLTGNTPVKEGDALNLTCRLESFPPSLITWTKPVSNKNLQNETEHKLRSNTGMATLVIPHVTAQDSGWYRCTAKYLNTTQTIRANVTVILLPKILSSSGCVLQSEVLTCVCASRGIPLPVIKWPLLEKHTEYSVITTVSNYTVNSTLMVSVADSSNTTTVCVSSNKNGNVKQNLTMVMNELLPEDQTRKSSILTRPEVIAAFLIGALLSATLCCLTRLCHRKKMKSSRNLADKLEMETGLQEPLINGDQTLEQLEHSLNNHHPVAVKGTAASGKSSLDLDDGPKEVAYASLDFSLLKRKSLTKTKKRETTETEYAEIKEKHKATRQDSHGEQGKVEGTPEDDKETKLCLPAEEGCNEEVYSNVKDIMWRVDD